MQDKQHIETGVTLPESGIIDVAWMTEMLEKVNIFSQELMNYGKGEVFFMAFTNLSTDGYEQAITDLGYTVETSNKYIDYLQKRLVLEAIKSKFYTAISLSGAEFIPDDIQSALSLCDICVAKYGKLTAENLRKASVDSGTLPKKMSDAAITVEALKKKSLNEWLLNEHNMSEDDIHQASKIHTEGKAEYLEKMLQAYSLLENWKDFYDLIAAPVHASDNIQAQRFLADMQDASVSIVEYLASEQAFLKLTALKETFANEIYPKISYEASK